MSKEIDFRSKHRVKAPGLQTIMSHLMPDRTQCEVYLKETLDITELLKDIEGVNEQHPDYKTTVFHCLVFACWKMAYERPMMNRFIQGHALFERELISSGFIARRRFTDHSDEALLLFTAKPEDTVDTLSYNIAGVVHETRKSASSTGGVDALLDKYAKVPRPVLMLIVRIVRWLDFWGIAPRAFTDGDPNYATFFLSNLGSVHCPAVYHHLNNYGTNSIMITLGEIRKEEFEMPDGTKQIRDVVDIGCTVDERIADGFYFARSIKLVKHLFLNPELLHCTLETPSGYDYK